jgi:hypothetical protein
MLTALHLINTPDNCRPTWLPATREQAVCHTAPLHAALTVGDGSGAALRLENPWLGGIHPDETNQITKTDTSIDTTKRQNGRTDT